MIIDAGSSGSRVHVYQISPADSSSLPVVFQKGNVLKNKVALSAFLGRTHESGTSIAPLIKYAEKQVSISAMHYLPRHSQHVLGF